MPSDTEPRYRLVDSNGNVVGSLYAEADGTLKLQEGTSGSDNEVSVATDGTLSAPAVSTVSATIEEPSNISSVTEVGEQLNFVKGTTPEIADDESHIIYSGHNPDKASLVSVSNKTANRGAIFAASFNGVNELSDTLDIYATSDTDGANCVYVDTNNNLIIKNRTGNPAEYNVFMIVISG